MPQTKDLKIPDHAVREDEQESTKLEVTQARPALRRSHSSASRVSIEPLKNTILKSHGRPPWYDENGNHLCEPFVIGIAGGSASGKTHVARQILRSLDYIPSVVILSQDSFYKELNESQLQLAFSNQYDFDHPDALDMGEFASCLADLRKGRQTNIPIYSFQEHQRLKHRRYLYGASIIITEGIMTLYDANLRSLYDLKVFVKCDSDLMLARRITRDTKERGREVSGIIDQYLRFVKPAYDDFVLPTSRFADIIVPGLDNNVAIDLITTHIRRKLDERSISFRESMARMHMSDASLPWSDTPASVVDGVHLPPNLHIIAQTPQIKGIYTILRDRNTPREDFIFFVDRLSTFLAEKALELLPFREKSVMTLVSAEYEGKELDASCVCGVSILRSGGPLEKGLRRVINNIRMGSLLIQTDQKTGEPLLLHLMLPVCIRDRAFAPNSYVLLLDAQIGTGAAAFMAIRTLLDHGVLPDHIVFVTFLVARDGGIAALRRAFPKVRIVCGAVDNVLVEKWIESAQYPEGEGNGGDDKDETEKRRIWAIEPGMGQIGDRYYL